MNIHTERFGQVKVPDDKIIKIDGGVIGFEDKTRFILLDFLEKSPLKWLQSTEDGALAFVVCDPWHFFKDYDPDISAEDKKEINLGSQDDLVLLTIATVPADISQTSLNLLSPIIINMDKMAAKQIILYDSAYTTKHKVFRTIKVNNKELAKNNSKKSNSL